MCHTTSFQLGLITINPEPTCFSFGCYLTDTSIQKRRTRRMMDWLQNDRVSKFIEKISDARIQMTPKLSHISQFLQTLLRGILWNPTEKFYRTYTSLSTGLGVHTFPMSMTGHVIFQKLTVKKKNPKRGSHSVTIRKICSNDFNLFWLNVPFGDWTLLLPYAWALSHS